jgi:hypothetical protein
MHRKPPVAGNFNNYFPSSLSHFSAHRLITLKEFEFVRLLIVDYGLVRQVLSVYKRHLCMENCQSDGMPAERIYRNTCNEELANLNRDVAPQAL